MTSRLPTPLLPVLSLLFACASPRHSVAPDPGPNAGSEAAPQAAPANEEQAIEPAEPRTHDWDPRSCGPERLEQLDSAIQEELASTWNIRSVHTAEDVLRVQTGMKVVDERVFRSMLPLIALVYEREGGVPRVLRRIEVANRMGRDGWILTDAQLLENLMDVPLAGYDATVEGVTRRLER